MSQGDAPKKLGFLQMLWIFWWFIINMCAIWVAKDCSFKMGYFKDLDYVKKWFYKQNSKFVPFVHMTQIIDVHFFLKHLKNTLMLFLKKISICFFVFLNTFEINKKNFWFVKYVCPLLFCLYHSQHILKVTTGQNCLFFK